MRWLLWLGGAIFGLNAAFLLCAAMLSSQLSRDEEVDADRRAWLKAQEGRNP